MVWILFVICIASITVSGSYLSRYGDAIADKNGLGGSWGGIILLATITSLPELVTGISSVTIANMPDIAVGDVLGSCVFNLGIIVVLDAIHRPTTLFSKASQGHILSAGFSVVLLGVVGGSLFLSSQFNYPEHHFVGIYTPVIILLYIAAVRTIFRYEKKRRLKFVALESDQYPSLTMRQVVVRYCAAAAVIVVAGSFLPFIGDEISRQMNWHHSFVGTLFIAFATSLPEIVVTVAALRLGALDMAIANLFGSNLFNILILALDDLLYVKGPLLSHVATSHGLSIMSAMLMTGLAMIGLLLRSTHRLANTTSWISVLLLMIQLVVLASR